MAEKTENRHEPDARWRHLTGLELLGELAGLVHTADIVGAVEVLAVDEHLWEPARRAMRGPRP